MNTLYHEKYNYNEVALIPIRNVYCNKRVTIKDNELHITGVRPSVGQGLQRWLQSKKSNVCS